MKKNQFRNLQYSQEFARKFIAMTYSREFSFGVLILF